MMVKQEKSMNWKNDTEFRKRVNFWARKIRAQPKVVHMRQMTRKWASCSTSGIISFSDQLLSENKVFGEYVIVHELLHLKIPNHGMLFKSLLGAYLPDWRQRAKPAIMSDPTSLNKELPDIRSARNKSVLTKEQIEEKRAYARRRARMIREGTWYSRKRSQPILS